MSSTPHFEFQDDPAAYSATGACVVYLPTGIRSKQTLFKCLAQRLQLPGWFGGNWDALEDSLRDLTWLPEGQAVAIVHEDLPFGAGESRETYFAILKSAAEHWRGRGDRTFVVIFPGDAKPEVLQAT